MESWIIYWLIGWFFIWLSNYLSKVVANWNINKHKIFLYSNLCFIIIPLVYFSYNFDFSKLSILVLLLAIIRIVTALEKNLFIIEWLKYIETNLFFPLHKIIHIFLSFLIWMVAFWEYLKLNEFLGIWLWIVVILLLNSKENRKVQINYKKGVSFLILSNLMIFISSSINKYITYINFDIPTYMFLSWIFWVLYLLTTKKDIYSKISKKQKMNEAKMWILKWILTFIWFFSFMTSLEQGPFVLVQMINSSSIFIPIILSWFFYKENISFKKWSALLLFLAVIYLINL